MSGNVSSSENSMGYFIIAILVIIFLWIIWYFGEYHIKDAIRWIRWSQMWLVSLIVDQNYAVLWAPYGQVPIKYNFESALDHISEWPFTQLDDARMSYIHTMAMTPLRYIFGISMMIMGIFIMFRGPTARFRRVLNLDGLIWVQSKIFPVIAPFVKFNPSDQPVRPPGAPVPAELPLFSEALGPEEWLAFNQIPVPDGKVDRTAAAEAFAQQLGAPWRGAQNLKGYKKVLLASFCLKAARKRDWADRMLSDLALCWTQEKGLVLSGKLLSEANKVLKNSDLSKIALTQANRHAYETTALLRALDTARNEGGVLAPAQFVWLRGYDRALWYPLNNLGRTTYHMEGIGAIAHYKMEKLTDRPIPRPKVDKAVDTIIEYMESLKARPIPQLDYSMVKRGSKKSGVQKPKSAGIKKPKAA